MNGWAVTWGDLFPEETECGSAAVRCYNCGIVRFYEDPDGIVPTGFGKLCPDCKRAGVRLVESTGAAR